MKATGAQLAASMDAANDEYRRRARRLRWQLRDRPGAMQQALGQLAAEAKSNRHLERNRERSGIEFQSQILREYAQNDPSDISHPVRVGQRPVMSQHDSRGSSDCLTSGRARTNEVRAAEVVFTDAVRQRLDGKVLRYTCREELLRLAGEMGIGRFEANLLIATAQHQASAASRSPLPQRRRSVSRIAMVSAAMVVQSIVLLGLWLILR